MATKRIDINRTTPTDSVRISYDYHDFKSQSLGTGITLLSAKNWDVFIDENTNNIFIESKSNSCKGKKKTNFNIHLDNGSLFLYNSSTDWYWYFRDKETQDFLDKFNISKLISIPDDGRDLKLAQYHYVTIYSDITIIFDSCNNKSESTIQLHNEDTEHIVYYPQVEYVRQIGNLMQVKTNLSIPIDSFLLVQEADGYRKLYINDAYNLNAVKKYLESLDSILLTEPRPYSEDVIRRCKEDAEIR